MAAGVYFLRWLGLRLWSRRGESCPTSARTTGARRSCSGWCVTGWVCQRRKVMTKGELLVLCPNCGTGGSGPKTRPTPERSWPPCGLCCSRRNIPFSGEYASFHFFHVPLEPACRRSFSRVLQDLSTHVAKVLGSCGHFYAVEYLSAGHAWDQNIFSLEEVVGSGSLAAWSARQKVHRIALSFLDMVHHFDNDFTHRVHLCDVKPENFAIRKDLTVVAIDVDMAFFEPKMEDILDQNCSSDDDCNFFDCSSSCNLMKRRCSRHRSNSNLQVICEKIFRLWFSPTLLGAKAGLPLQVSVRLTPSLPPKVLPHCSLPLVARSRWSFSGPCRNVPSPTAWAADKAGTSIGASWIS
ncbi:divergent protein kinase domain 1C isoform X6 [Nerophis lumbriciformis]|uniref:divergent protein kinase domain 1C isoform X6 n=1 Tax=Nerophis lumbriciformis TaxID=546530 RepID=UPI002ADF3E61|nr:divergent protein kinase domain 1C isoform X6 [Nerophis lumbriciformis]